jgi:dCMP deaminase
MNVAEEFAQRSTCASKKVGAVIVRDNRPISTGYNGDYSGAENCSGILTCLTLEGRCGGDTIHAEMNAILFAARNGIKTEGASIYVTCCPCKNCAKAIIQAGITSVYFKETYRDMSGLTILRAANINITQTLEVEA